MGLELVVFLQDVHGFVSLTILSFEFGHSTEKLGSSEQDPKSVHII